MASGSVPPPRLGTSQKGLAPRQLCHLRNGPRRRYNLHSGASTEPGRAWEGSSSGPSVLPVTHRSSLEISLSDEQIALLKDSYSYSAGRPTAEVDMRAHSPSSVEATQEPKAKSNFGGARRGKSLHR